VSLRQTVATLTILVTVIAVLIAGALLVLTTALHRTTSGAADSAENVRLALQNQILLKSHPREKDLLLQRESENRIRSRLDDAWRFVGDEEERRTLEKAEALIGEYFELFRDGARTAAEVRAAHASAYGALGELAAINLAQSKVAQQEAERWDRYANVIAITATALLVVLAGAVLIWLRARAFEPIFEFAAAMERFGQGDHDARAAEHGPQELREMCRRFNEMASAIADQREAQSAFLAGVAHDLRTPLSTLQMSVVLLLNDPALGSHAGLRVPLERIGRQVKRMDRMLGDFLDSAKIEAGLLDLRVEIHDARTIVSEVVDLFEGVSSHELEVRLPAERVPILCDQLRIEQVLTNLISNAIKYSPSGSAITVELRAAGPKAIELSVRDRGVGIPEDGLERLFQPFSRVGLSTEAVPGVGLGLYVVGRIVEAHNGRIEVESAVGQGSTFRVTLPLEYEGIRVKGSR
jgi:two-component system, OmpR family, sensor histidine kinase MtrB